MEGVDAMMADSETQYMDIDLGVEDFGHTVSHGATCSKFCSSKYMTPAGCQQCLDSCMSFTLGAALGALAGLTYDIQNAPKFSKQEMVDCIPIKKGGISYEKGCGYIARNGLHMEEHYPYISAYDIPCRCNDPELRVRRKYSFEHYEYFDPKDVTKILKTLEIHPLTAGICIYESFNNYCTGHVSESDLMGVYSPLEGEVPLRNEKDGKVFEHAILVIGYGYENNELYYIIKNFWSVFWGVNGYARVAAHLLSHFGFPRKFKVIPPLQ